MKHVVFIAAVCFSLISFGQGTLEFNQVILISSADGQVTVPAGKVWKIEHVTASSARYFNYYSSSYSTVTWNTNNPNPCTGATSGNTSYPAIDHTPCSYADNYILINGIRTAFSSGSPLWMPAAATLQVNETPCRNTVTFNLSNTSHYRDLTTSAYKCGPFAINAGTIVPNSWVVSIVEFNIIP